MDWISLFPPGTPVEPEEQSGLPSDEGEKLEQ